MNNINFKTIGTEITKKEFKQSLAKEQQELGKCHWCPTLFKAGEHKWTARDSENPQDIIKLCKPCFLYLLFGTYEEPVSDNPIIQIE